MSDKPTLYNHLPYQSRINNLVNRAIVIGLKYLPTEALLQLVRCSESPDLVFNTGDITLPVQRIAHYKDD